MNFKYKWNFLKILPALSRASVCRAGGLFGQGRVDQGHSEFGTTVNLGFLHRTLCRRLRMLDTAVGQNQPNGLKVMAEASGYFSKFRLTASSLNSAEKLENTSSMLVLDLAHSGSSPDVSLAASNSQYGTFSFDSQSARYNISWPSWDDFLADVKLY